MQESRSLAGLLFAWRRFLLRATFAAALAAVVVSLLLPRWYSAAATIRPPQEGEGGFGILQLVNQLGTGFGAGGRGRALLGRTPEVDLMIGVLKSRRLRGQIVDRFDLVEIYDVKTREHAIKALGEHLRVNTTPEGLIEVRVEARDRERAAAMANAFVDLLDDYNRQASVEDARRTIGFIRGCLEENRERMQEAAEALRRFQEERGAVQISEQVRVTVEAVAALEAERTKLGIERGVLANFATRNEPRIRDIDARVRELDKRIDSLLGRTPRPAAAGEGGEDGDDAARRDGVLLPLGELPSLGLEYADLKREVLVQEKVYEFLTSQFEEARIREARDLRTVEVLDEAVPPIRKSRPRRSLVVLLTTALAFVLASGVAVAAEAALEAGARPGADRELAGVLRIARRLRGWGRREEPGPGTED